jgi:NAD(P)H-dependent FMN reductase
MKLNIPVILGTARVGRQSEKAARYILGSAKEAGLQSEIIDVRDFPLSVTDRSPSTEAAKRLEAKILPADGLIIVSPEYNHSFPGELKLMLDLLYIQYNGKPLGICGVSGGPLGGARMVEQLRLVAIEFQMAPIRETLYFGSVQNTFDENGNLLDQAYIKRAKTFLDQMAWYATALKKGRES